MWQCDDSNLRTLYMQPVLRIALLLFFASCQQPQQQQQAAANVSHTIEVVPLGAEQNISLAKEVAAKLKAVLPDVVIDSLEQLPVSAYYKARNRYRADSLIRWLSSQSTATTTTRLGITNVDISTTKDGKADWGVLGLGYMPGKAAVASSYRLKDKSLLWKVAIHELGHTAGLPHCPDRACFMRDAEGGDPTGSETGFCEKCKAVLRGKHWKL